MKLIGNTAIVTGGNKGIGFGLADGLMAHGANVTICGTNVNVGMEAAEKLNEKHKKNNKRAIFIKCDVSKSSDVKDLFETTIKELGSVHILCNNAGINPPYLRTWDQSEEVWDKVLDVDLKGAFLCMKEVIPYWIENKIQGAIINTSSINYNCATDGMVHYCAAKAGLSQMTKAVAGEVGRYGIRVNAIAPGLIITDMSKGFAKGEFMQAFKERSPLYEKEPEKFPGPEDCAKLVVFLASDYAEWITGETIAIDGGNHIRGLHSYYDYYERQQRS